MGKASKWFRGLLGIKKSDSSKAQTQPPNTNSSNVKPPPPLPTKKKWSFVKSYREKDQQQLRSPVVGADNDEDPNKHAIAVAAATAAVAEAAVAAAQAAAAVVRLTSSGRAISTDAPTTVRATSFGSGNAGMGSAMNVSMSGTGYGNREEWAAVMIQSHFRAYLSRRALRALKALVKLQAIVRGRIERKRRQMRELFRAHTLAVAGRAGLFDSPLKANHLHYTGPGTPEKFEHLARTKSKKHGENMMMFRRNGSKNSKYGNNQNCRMDVKLWENEGSNVKSGSRYDDRNDKILDVDNGKPQIILKRRNLFHSSHLSIGSDQFSHSFTTSKDSTAHQTIPSLSSFEVQSMSPLKFSHDVVDHDHNDPFCTAESSPQYLSASSKGGNSKRGPFTPTKSDGSRSCLSGYSDYPNYMSCTESSKAKMRSLSAPKQRPQYERSSSTKRFSIHGYGEIRVNPQRVSALHTSFSTKAYPGSGRLDRLGMPMPAREESVGFSGSHWHHF